MYYLVYKIIQLSTGREYIGQHKTTDLNDGYMGSGTLIVRAVQDNPADFVKVILRYCASQEEMNELEAALVTEEYLLQNFPEKTFNQVPGGKITRASILKWDRVLHPEKYLARKPGRIGTYKKQKYHRSDIEIKDGNVMIGKRCRLVGEDCGSKEMLWSIFVNDKTSYQRINKMWKKAEELMDSSKCWINYENNYCFFTGTIDDVPHWYVKSSSARNSPFVLIS